LSALETWNYLNAAAAAAKQLLRRTIE